MVRSMNLNVSISKVNLPSIKSQCIMYKTTTETTKALISMLGIVSTLIEAEIDTLYGICLDELYALNLLECSPIFYGTSKQSMIS